MEWSWFQIVVIVLLLWISLWITFVLNYMSGHLSDLRTLLSNVENMNVHGQMFLQESLTEVNDRVEESNVKADKTYDELVKVRQFSAGIESNTEKTYLRLPDS